MKTSEPANIPKLIEILIEAGALQINDAAMVMEYLENHPDSSVEDALRNTDLFSERQLESIRLAQALLVKPQKGDI